MRKYREIYCPVCKRKYMYELPDEYDGYVQELGIKHMGWFNDCPKCDTSLFVEDHVLNGVPLREIPDGWIHYNVTER